MHRPVSDPFRPVHKIYPVSPLVNNPKTDDPRCIEPVQLDRDMFERQWLGDA